jgi:PKD domain
MYDRNGPRDRDDVRRTRPTRSRRRRWFALAAVLIAIAAGAIPAVGSPTKDVTVAPGAPPGAPGLTDLDELTYAQAKQRLDELSTVTLPVSIPGLELIDVNDVRLGSNDAGRSLALTGSANLLNQDVDLLVTAIWPDADSTEPKLSIAAKTNDLALSEVNPLWDRSYGDVRFATARMAISTAAQDIDPAALPESAREFYSEPVTLTGGVNFAGDLEVSGRLADAFGYAGHSGNVELEGSLSGSAAALFGRATDEQLGDLSLKATLHKSPSAPQWIADRTSTYEFSTQGIRIEEDLTVAVDGTTNRFRGVIGIDPTGPIVGDITLVGALDMPFGLDRLNVSDVGLRLSRDGGTLEGGLVFDVAVDNAPVHVIAGFVTGGGSTSVNFSIDGALTVPRLAAFGGALLGTPVAPIPGTGDIGLDRISFSYSPGIFSVGARTTIKGIGADAVMTLRRGTPLLALRVNDVRMDALLPGAGDTLGRLQLPSLTLTATTLTELADPTPQEREFFGDEPVQFSPGLNVQGKLPLDQLGAGEVLGYPAGSEATLSGTLGANVTLSRVNGSSASLRELALSATLPPATNSRVLPRWVRPSGDTTLGFRYTNGSIAASFATAATVTLGNAPFSTTIEGRLTRAGQRTSIGFNGTISNWRRPFGLNWINSLDQATVKLDTTFGGGQPATVDASVMASTLLGGKRFELEFAVSRESSTSASLTARFADRARLGEIMQAFPNLGDAAIEVARNRGLDELEIGPVAVTATTGSSSTFELTGATTFAGVTSDVLVALRPGGAFTVGVKARGKIDLRALTPEAPSLDLPVAAMVLSNQSGRFRPDQLTDGEFNFYKSLYGCAADATRTSCSAFRELELQRALKLVAAFDMGDQMETMASAIGIQTTGNVRLEGSVPVFGGRDFALTASLGNFRFAQQPDWFDRGDVALEIGTEGLKFVGALRVKIEREDWTRACDGMLIETRCYDLLDFRVSAGVALQPTPKLTLAGTLTTQNPWRNAFGQEWLEINRLALQLGVKLGAGPEVTMGFQGDVKIGSKDIAAALKVGLSPAPPPAFVRPNLIGFSAASKAGLALSDLIWLNEKLTGTRLDTASLPDVSLRNLYLQYSQETDRDLCLTQGVRFNADLYVGNNLPPIESGTLDPNGCRTLEVDPETRQTCLAYKANGCLASVYGRLDGGGVIAGAELSGFTLGPIALNNSMLALALTPTKQQLRVKGGLRIANGSYEFAKGEADLDISRSGIAFKGDAALFNQRMRGFIEANAAFDLRNPSFTVRGWLSATDRGVMDGLVSPRAQGVKNTLIVLRPLLQFMSGNGSVANVRDLKAKMVSAGVTVPYQVDKMITVIGDMQGKIDEYGRPALTFDVLLNGLGFDVPGIPGVWTPRCWGPVINGTCVGVPAPSVCAGVERSGQCWTTPPFRVSVPGICETLGVPSADCSWAGLMRRYVRPAMRSAVHAVTGVWVDETTFATTLTNVLNSLSGTGALVSIDCAYFSADASALAQGNVNLELATRLRLFGQPIQFGARWNFAAAGGSPSEIASGIFRSLFSPSSTTCPDQPAAPAQGVPSPTLTASLSPSSLDENGETTLRATFDEIAMDYPAVTVVWGDGATTTVPAGESRTITPSHRYANEGNYPVTVAVGTFTKRLTATVRNVAPRLHYVLAGDGLAVDERGVVSLRGSFTDPGEADRHTLNVNWGDGSVPEVYSLAAGARTIDVAHRYADDARYTVTATLADNAGGSHTRTTAATVRNVAPSRINLRAQRDPIEGTLAPYRITFEDPGERDAHTVTVDWADGRPAQAYAVPAGQRSIEVPYLYEDDGARDVRVTVSDDDGGRGDATVPVAVTNVKPQVSLKLPGTVRAGEQVRLVGTITDPGVADAQTVTINWGTDKPETIVLEAGKRTFETAMQYDAPGRYSITAEANDGDDRDRASGGVTVVA